MRAFRNRTDAGHRLAASVRAVAGPEPVVLGLPRGGVVVAAAVADDLRAPLDVVVVRKLGAPGRPELAVGAIAEGGIRLVDEQLVALVGASGLQLARVEAAELRALEERVSLLRSAAPPDLAGRTALLVDDGIATGATATAGALAAREWGAERVVVAAPVGAPDAVQGIRDADEVVCLLEPRDFVAVGAHYADFRQVTDDEVMQLLRTRRTPGSWVKRLGDPDGRPLA